MKIQKRRFCFANFSTNIAPLENCDMPRHSHHKMLKDGNQREIKDTTKGLNFAMCGPSPRLFINVVTIKKLVYDQGFRLVSITESQNIS